MGFPLVLLKELKVACEAELEEQIKSAKRSIAKFQVRPL
jgi:hypothetical protein